MQRTHNTTLSSANFICVYFLKKKKKKGPILCKAHFATCLSPVTELSNSELCSDNRPRDHNGGRAAPGNHTGWFIFTWCADSESVGSWWCRCTAAVHFLLISRHDTWAHLSFTIHIPQQVMWLVKHVKMYHIMQIKTSSCDIDSFSQTDLFSSGVFSFFFFYNGLI